MSSAQLPAGQLHLLSVISHKHENQLTTPMIQGQSGAAHHAAEYRMGCGAQALLCTVEKGCGDTFLLLHVSLMSTNLQGAVTCLHV